MNYQSSPQQPQNRPYTIGDYNRDQLAKQQQRVTPTTVVQKPLTAISNSSIYMYVLKNKTYSLFLGAFILFTAPLLTNMAGARDNAPFFQDLLKAVCYPAVCVIGAAGYAMERSKKTQAERYNEDVQANIDHLVNKKIQRAKATERINHAFDIEDGMLASPLSMANNNIRTWNTVPQQLQAQPGYQQSPQASAQTSAVATQKTPNPVYYSNPVQTDATGNKVDPSKPQLSETDRIYDFIHEIGKEKLHNNLLVFGQNGDQKSTAMGYALKRWTDAEPGLVTMVIDRKFNGSSVDPTFKPLWDGLPVYKDGTVFNGAKFPFNSVYATMYPDIAPWIKIAKTLFNVRSSDNADKNDPLYDKTTKKHRPVLFILDDATTLLARNEKDKSQKAHETLLLDLEDLMTMGRDKQLYFWFITHTTTATGTGLTVPTIAQLSPIVGSTYCKSPDAMKNLKIGVEQSGVDLAAASSTQRAKGFATAWKNFPYIPPAPIKGTREMLVAEKIVCSHTNAPHGFDVQDYQKAVLKKIGFPVKELGKLSMAEFLAMKEVPAPSVEPPAPTPVPAPQTSQPLDAEDSLDAMETFIIEEIHHDTNLQTLRDWWDAHTSRIPTDDELFRAIQIVFDSMPVEAIARFPSIKNSMYMEKTSFSNMVFGKGGIPSDPKFIGTDPTAHIDLSWPTRQERQSK
jgi:hypothetical protein